MSAESRILQPDLVEQLSNLQLHANLVVEGLLAGLHSSPLHGSSIEFSEHKEYSPGEDLRHLDWKVYGRADRYVVKKYEDETNLKAIFLLDGSASMGYRAFKGERPSKLELGRVLAAALALVMLRQQDSPGLVTCQDGRIARDVPPRASKTHWQEFLQSLVLLQPEGGSDLLAPLDTLLERQRGRIMLFLISDLLDVPQALFAKLKQFRARKHDVTLFHVLDPDERDFPFDRMMQFEDMETEGMVIADPDGIREEYLRAVEEWLTNVRLQAMDGGMDYQSVLTDEDPASVLMAYLKRRERR